MPIKLLAIDLDGTLLRSDHTPHPAVPDAIAEARGQGIEVVIASGRSIQSIDRVAGPHLPVLGAVASNGSDVWSPDRKSLARSLLSRASIETVLEYVLEKDLHLSCYTPTGTVAIKDSPLLSEYRTLVQGIPVPVVDVSEVLDGEIFKLVIIAEASTIPERRRELTEELTNCPVELTESAPRYLEFLPQGTNKGSGLARLCEHLQIDMSDVAAIGDYRNDLEMLRMVGLSAAVENALAEVKSLSKHTVSSNELGGVAEFIRNYVLQP